MIAPDFAHRIALALCQRTYWQAVMQALQYSNLRCLLGCLQQDDRQCTHCEPLLLGPALAIDTVKGRSCRRLRLNSSSNSPPQMLWPPVPSPAMYTALVAVAKAWITASMLGHVHVGPSALMKESQRYSSTAGCAGSAMHSQALQDTSLCTQLHSQLIHKACRMEMTSQQRT